MTSNNKVVILDGRFQPYSTNNTLPVESVNNGFESTANSSQDTLGVSGVFTGSWEDTLAYNNIIVGITAVEDSATDGLAIQWSHDGTHVDDTDSFTISAGASKVFTFTPARRYIRIVYTNGTTGGDIDLQTMYKKGGIKASSHRIQDNIINDDDAELVKAVLTGENGGGTFKNVIVTADGNLAISNNSSGLSIAQGNVSGVSFVHKFGDAPDFDTSDGEVSIWDGANDSLLGGGAMTYTYSATADIGLLSSSNAGDTQDIEIQGILSDDTLSTQTFTLTGQTDVDLSVTGSDFKRVFRMKNIGSTDFAGNIYLRTNGSTQTNGVPDTANTVRAIVNDGNNQTLMSLYTIPAGKTGYLRSFFASLAGAKKSSSFTIRLKARPSGQVFQLKHKTALVDAGTSHFQHNYVEPEVFSAGTDIEITAQTNAAAITGSDIAAGFDIVLVDD